MKEFDVSQFFEALNKTIPKAKAQLTKLGITSADYMSFPSELKEESYFYVSVHPEQFPFKEANIEISTLNLYTSGVDCSILQDFLKVSTNIPLEDVPTVIGKTPKELRYRIAAKLREKFEEELKYYERNEDAEYQNWQRQNPKRMRLLVLADLLVKGGD